VKKNFLSEQVINTCKKRLLELKSQLLNQMKSMAADFNNLDKSRGDESDLSAAHQEEHNFLITQSRTKMQILEVEFALARIENGTFGICEETEEKIETERLLAIPWTRLSIEGAEIREAQVRKSSKNFSTSV